MIRHALAALCLTALPLTTTATNVSYVLEGTFDPFVDVSVSVFGDPGTPVVNDGTLRNGFDLDVGDAFGSLPLLLTFDQDTSAPFGGPAGPNGAIYTDAISYTELSIDGQTAGTSANDDFFAFNSNNQHQWSIFGGGTDVQGVLDDVFVAQIDFDFNGENFQLDEALFFDGFNLFLIDKDESLFTGTPPSNSPFFSDSFDQPGDFLFLDLVWRGFITLEDSNQDPIDFDVEIRLSASIDSVQSSAVPIPLPPPFLLLAAGVAMLAGRRVSGA